MKNINPRLIEIKKLSMRDIPELLDLWNNDPIGYNQYFIPFEINYEKLKSILENAVKDVFMAVVAKGRIAGFFMLRGLDAGYEIPSYGVWISAKYANKGLAKLTLHYSISLCKIAGIKKIMLKVHPDNKIALKMYKNFGFVEAGVDDKNKNIIMNKDLK
jgi:RimJ/RimL family protein N-acetyltransferase